MTARILLLAGTAEARALAQRLTAIPEFTITASLAGVTANPAKIAAITRSGGFGGASGLAAYLTANAVAAVIDATHPFAAGMTANAAAACTATDTPRLLLLRPAWQPIGDWCPFPELSTAIASIPSGARVLVTIGRNEIARFADRSDITCILRTIEPVDNLPAHITPLIARPPFAFADEVALMRDRAITHLVAKNSGGAGRAKLDAAAELGLPIVIIERPPPPPGPIVSSVDDAVAWTIKSVAIHP